MDGVPEKEMQIMRKIPALLLKKSMKEISSLKSFQEHEIHEDQIKQE